MSGLANRRALLASGLAAAMFAASGVPVQSAARRGGTIRAGLGGGTERDDWSGAGHDGLFMQAIGAGAVFDTLTEVAADGALRGELAIDWEPLDGARTWHVSLRPGVTFHDGKPLDSHDVVASLGDLWDMTAAGPEAVRIRLAAPDADFPFRLADPRRIIHPAGALGGENGTGLYRVAAFEPGRRFVGKRVESHWKDGRAGWFERVEVMAIDPAAVRLAALRSGRVDAIDGLDLHAVGMVRAGGDHAVQQAGDWLQAVSTRVATPQMIGRSRAMDDARFLERWWAA